MDCRGRDAGDVDRPAAKEHAEKAGGQNGPRIPRQRNSSLAYLGERKGRETHGNDRPAEEGEREGRHRACEPTRQDHIGDLRDRDQHEAEERERALRAIGDWFAILRFHVAHARSNSSRAPVRKPQSPSLYGHVP
jgi:hypothetical protein